MRTVVAVASGIVTAAMGFNLTNWKTWVIIVLINVAFELGRTSK